MKKFLPFVLVFALAACNNNANVKVETDSQNVKMDTADDRVENSKVMDSIKLRGGRIVDTVENKSNEVWDSTKAKTQRLEDKVEKKYHQLTKKDTSR